MSLTPETDCPAQVSGCTYSFALHKLVDAFIYKTDCYAQVNGCSHSYKTDCYARVNRYSHSYKTD